MAVIKTTWNFSSIVGSNLKFSETLYNDSATITAVDGAITPLVPLRLAILGWAWRLDSIIKSDDLIFRDSRAYVGAGVPSVGQYGSAGVASTDPTFQPLETQNALDVRLEATELHRRVFQIRGLLKRDILGDNWSPSPAMSAAMDSYLGALKSSTNGWCLKTRSYLSGFEPDRHLSFLSVDADGVVSISSPFSVPPATTPRLFLVFFLLQGVIPRAARAFQVTMAFNSGGQAKMKLRGWGPRGLFSNGTADSPGAATFALFNLSTTRIDAAIIDVLSTRRTGAGARKLRGRSSRAR